MLYNKGITPNLGVLSSLYLNNITSLLERSSHVHWKLYVQAVS